jgi:hypothetical protein
MKNSNFKAHSSGSQRLSKSQRKQVKVARGQRSTARGRGWTTEE